MNVNFDEINERIHNGTYPKLGSGSGRRVYDLGNGYALKAAKNQKGIAQNEMEYFISVEYISDILAKVFLISDDFKYLIVEKAEKILNMSDIKTYYHVMSLSELLERNDVKTLIDRYHLVRTDLLRRSSWGMVRGVPVIIDYGFTKQIRDRYYR